MLKTLAKRRPELLHAGVTAVLLVASSLLISGQYNLLQRWLSDSAQRSSSPHTESPVAVIAIDEDSRAKLGEWPWSNSLHASLVEHLKQSGVRAVAFATPLYTDKTGLDSKADELLEQSILAQGRVVLPLEVSSRTGNTEVSRSLQSVLTRGQRHFADNLSSNAITTHALDSDGNDLFAAATGVGHVFQPVDVDGVTRRDAAAVQLNTQLLPSLALALANLATEPGKRMIVTPTSVQLSEAAPATELDATLSYSPRLRAVTIPSWSYWEVLSGAIGKSQLAGKSVVIGITDGASADRIQTPIGTLPRVQFIALSAANLIENHALHHPAWAYALEWLLGLILIALSASIFMTLKKQYNWLIGIAFVVAALALDWQLMRTGIDLHVVALLPATLGTLLFNSLWSPARPGTTSTGSAAISMETLKTLALTLHGQGQLDLAYETLRRCTPNQDTFELLYRLAQDYERRNDLLKAAQIHRYISEIDRQYKDSTTKLQQLQQQIERPKAGTDAPKPLRNITKPRPVASATRRSSTETLGRYEIDKQIGKGAMGVVYLGRDPKINRVVAIKAIPLTEEFEDEDLSEARERFFREAEMAGRLNHPGIVTIFDAGEDRGLAYIAMEYIQGEHLSYYCDPARLLPARKVMTLAIRVAEALHYAHLQNVVHRDIKPANIMYNIQTDALKITDFGIARLSDVSRTKTGIVLGTPSFMSPEQLEGRPLDGRSDLFALGVSLYQMLTGQLPFRADSMTRLMNNIATEPHPPIRSLRPELPDCLEQIIDRCLAKSAEDRYQSGLELAEALRLCMRDMAA